MSFLKIADPIKREQTVREFLAIKKNIRANELAEKTGKIELQEDLSEFFKPVTETQKETQKETREAITKGLEPIKKDIEELPQKLPQQKPSSNNLIILGKPYIPPPNRSKDQINEIFPGSDTKFGIYEKGRKFFIGDKIVEDIKGADNKSYISIGDAPYKKVYLLTKGLNELLTSKEPAAIDVEITANDISMYNNILNDTNTMYEGNNPKSGKLKSEDDPEVTETGKWQFIIKPAWNKLQKQKKSKGKTGKLVIPSDPNALLEKLDLLMASKAAGNTGVRNELVSVCDELKRQGIFDSNIYKKIMSLL